MAPLKTKDTRRSSLNPSSSSSNHAVSATSRRQQAPQPAAIVDDFSARRSARVASGRYVADNDTWVEALAVCEMPKDTKKATNSAKQGIGLLKKLKSKSNICNSENLGDSNLLQGQDDEMVMAAQRLTLRPYFQSQNSGQRVWDEPPSGASSIVYASSEARKMAQAQLEEMRATYAHTAVSLRSEREEEAISNKNLSDMEKTSGVRRLALPKLFKKSSRSWFEAEGQSCSTPLVASSNSDVSAAVRSSAARTGIPPSILEESINLAKGSSYERDLQMAMMLSMGIGRGSVMGVGDLPNNFNEADLSSLDFKSPNNCTPAAAARLEREQMALAIALSLAEEKEREGPLENCRQSKSEQTINRRTCAMTNEETNSGSSSRPKQTENFAPRPTIHQIESDFDIGYNGVV